MSSTRAGRGGGLVGQAVSLLAARTRKRAARFGITRRGRLATLTNVRAPSERNPTPRRAARWS